jgi:hypothetical protein
MEKDLTYSAPTKERVKTRFERVVGQLEMAELTPDNPFRRVDLPRSMILFII